MQRIEGEDARPHGPPESGDLELDILHAGLVGERQPGRGQPVGIGLQKFAVFVGIGRDPHGDAGARLPLGIGQADADRLRQLGSGAPLLFAAEELQPGHEPDVDGLFRVFLRDHADILIAGLPPRGDAERDLPAAVGHGLGRVEDQIGAFGDLEAEFFAGEGVFLTVGAHHHPLSEGLPRRGALVFAVRYADVLDAGFGGAFAAGQRQETKEQQRQSYVRHVRNPRCRHFSWFDPKTR